MLLLGAAAAQELKMQPSFDPQFRSSMAHYATIDRADGKVYEIFVNDAALSSWKAERRLPAGSQFVIESFLAERAADGALMRDARGRFVRSTSENEIHVSEKQADWAPSADCTSASLMRGELVGPGLWRMGAFDPRDGKQITAASQPQGKCHQCHTEARAEDFLLSRGLLDRFADSGEVAYISFTCGERDICFGGPPDLSNERPQCPDAFAKK